MVSEQNQKFLRFTHGTPYTHYSLLDKKSLLTASEFFASVKDVTAFNNSDTTINQMFNMKLKLVK
jgi:hypothetical protein